MSHTPHSTANPSPVYYHSILLTFRPFLVTGALAGSQQKQGAMWLREACRHATDAAQDTLVFIDNDLATTGSCKVRFLRCLTIVPPEDSDSLGWSNATESGVFRWTCLSHIHMHVSEILPWETESIQVYYTVENAERCPTFSVSEEDVHHCFDWSHGMITRSPWTPFASVRNA